MTRENQASSIRYARDAARRWNIATLALALLAVLPLAARAADFHSEDLRIPMAQAGSRGLEAFLIRPAAAGKYPLALISHGTPRDVDDRASMTARSYRAIAVEFARRGFAALVVLRRGYGTSPGGLVDSYGSCAHPDYRRALNVSVADLQAAIAAMKNRSDVTTEGMIAVGHSAGGLATVGLTAQEPPGLAAAISFAGGRGSASTSMVCGDEALVDTFREMGKTSRTPMLWVYAANDGFFGPSLAYRFRDAFASQGGEVSFVEAPAYGREGHYLFSPGRPADWTPYVDRFLREHHLPQPVSAIATLSPPPQLGNNGRQAFAQYLSHDPHKAFAVAPDGSFGWRSRMVTAADAEREALAACAAHSKHCALYAVDDRLY